MNKVLRSGRHGRYRTTRNKKLLGLLASLLGAKTLLGARGLTTRNKDATRGSWPYYRTN